MERIYEKDPVALETLYDRYADLVYSLATRMLGQDRAQDVVQEAFLKLWQSPESFKPDRGRFRSWFLSLVRNRAVDELRRDKRARAKTMQYENIEGLLENMPTDDANIERQVTLESKGIALVEALTQLPSEQRHVLMAIYFDGLSQSAAAEQLEIPLGTVKTRVRLAINKLRETFEAKGIEPWHN